MEDYQQLPDNSIDAQRRMQEEFEIIDNRAAAEDGAKRRALQNAIRMQRLEDSEPLDPYGEEIPNYFQELENRPVEEQRQRLDKLSQRFGDEYIQEIVRAQGIERLDL